MSLIQACFSCMVEATRCTVIWLLLEVWWELPPDVVLLTSSTSLKSLLCRSDDLCELLLDEIRWVVVVVLPSLAPLDWLDAEHTEAPDIFISRHSRRTSRRRGHADRGIGGRHAQNGRRSNIQSLCSKASSQGKQDLILFDAALFLTAAQSFLLQTKAKRNFELFLKPKWCWGCMLLCD